MKQPLETNMALFRDELERLLPSNLGLESNQIDLLATFMQEIVDWNKRTQLVSRADEPQLAKRHILESLAVADLNCFPDAGTALDLGTGAGLPGIPLSIIKPDLRFTLLDSRRLKVLFLKHVVRTLALSQTTVLCQRAEALSVSHAGYFDIVVARAVADLSTLWRWTWPLLRTDGQLLAQKGGELSEELDAFQRAFPEAAFELYQYNLKWQVDPSRMVVVVCNRKGTYEP